MKVFNSFIVRIGSVWCKIVLKVGFTAFLGLGSWAFCGGRRSGYCFLKVASSKISDASQALMARLYVPSVQDMALVLVDA